jgi:Icc-related predicted phosphoesterase
MPPSANRLPGNAALALAFLALGLVAGCAPEARGARGSCNAVGGPRLNKKLGGHGRITLGAVADTRGAAPATLAELERLVAQFRAEGVDAVVALGDLGTGEDEIAQVLVTLGKAGVPVLALAGETETERVFHAAVERARQASVDVVDLVAQRRIDTGEIDIVSIPGSPGASPGCGYSAASLAALRERAGDRWRPLILLAHTPPRGQGPGAVDWEQDHNGGDPAMMDLINALYPNLALFAHADDAGGRAQRVWLNVGGVTRGAGAVVDLTGGLPHWRLKGR